MESIQYYDIPNNNSIWSLDFKFCLVASHCRQKLAFLIDWFQGFLSKNVWQSIHSVSFNIKPSRIILIVLIHETMHHPPRWKNTRYLFCYFVTSLYELSLFSVEKYLSTESGIQISFSSLVSFLSFVDELMLNVIMVVIFG